jgi:rhodanese-related sulfurtransferase
MTCKRLIVKNILYAISLFFIALLVLSTSVWAHTDVSVSQALDMINTNNQLVVVDVREESNEYCSAGGHIPGALNYPWSSGVLEARYQELYPLDQEILVVCRSGSRSNAAATFLDNQGFTTIYDMVGGMLAWEGETVGCCYSDEECNDGLYCTGVETCVDLNCKPGTGNPCEAPEWCDEDLGSCVVCSEDYDCDGFMDGEDNCPNYHNPGQEDTLPPGGNGCGDTCECEGNFDGDQDCDGTDASAFKVDFGRSIFEEPCDTGELCKGDFDCDLDVDGSDAVVFKADFGRSQFSNPCPDCSTTPWCVYQ